MAHRDLVCETKNASRCQPSDFKVASDKQVKYIRSMLHFVNLSIYDIHTTVPFPSNQAIGGFRTAQPTTTHSLPTTIVVSGRQRFYVFT